MRAFLPRGFSSGTFHPGVFDFRTFNSRAATPCVVDSRFAAAGSGEPSSFDACRLADVLRGERCVWCWRDSRKVRRTGAVLLTVAMMLLPGGAFGQSAVKQAARETAAATTAGVGAPASAAVVAEYGRLPLSFEANEGQSAPEVKFLARGSRYALFLTEDGAVLALSKYGAGAPTRRSSAAANAVTKTDVIRMELVGASVDPKVSGVEPLAGKANYLIGNDPSAWHTGVPTYARVRYAGVYSGIDLVYYGNQRQLEYDFVIEPGASARQVRVRFEGARWLWVGADGNLRIVARHGEIAFEKPAVYQVRDGQKELVDGRFVLQGKDEVAFALGSYDAGRELVIDPVLAYSTYLGGSGGDSAAGIAVDAEGNAYVVGTTHSTDFPLKGNPYQTSNKAVVNGFSNVFVTKMNPAGSGLDYSTYLGGSGVPLALQNPLFLAGGDNASGIAIDRFGNAYITGTTYSTDFPVTARAFQKVNKGAALLVTNAFVTKLNPTGSGLVYSTYLGGSGIPPFADFAIPIGDSGSAIAVDSAGNAYVTGGAYSTDFPVSKPAFQEVNNAAGAASDNAFVCKLNAAGSGLIYSTYLGGSGQQFNFAGSTNYNSSGDNGQGIAVDAAGSAYVVGKAFSTDFPVTDNALQKTNNQGPLQDSTAFVAKLNAAGSALDYATYLGGSGSISAGAPSPFSDEANAIAINSAGNAYVTGTTDSSDFPITNNAFQNINRGQNVFVTEFNQTGSELFFSTFLGGTGSDIATGIALGIAGEIFVTGSTDSDDFPVTSGAFQTSGSGTFVSELSAGFEQLVYSTYLGGSFGAAGIALDPAGNIYVAGGTGSTDFPTTRLAFQHKNAGNVAYVAKFAVNSTEVPTAMSLGANSNPAVQCRTILFTAQVTPLDGGGEPTGEVRFGIDGNLVSVKDLDSNGRASIEISTLDMGTHPVTAVYLGDGTFAPSSANYVESVGAAGLALALVSGGGQETGYGTTFAHPLVFIVENDGFPQAGATVAFSSSDMRLSSLEEVSATNGEVSVSATPLATGNLAGHASVKIAGVPPVAFAETANPGVLTVTAKNESVPQGKPIPALTYSIAGFVNGDKASVVSGTPVLSTVPEGTAEGTYPITVAMGTLAATNYKFKFVDGTLTITPAGAVAKPVFTPNGNVFSTPPMVVMTDATQGAAIYYTTDGTTPTTKSSLYTVPITVMKTEVIEAIAVASGYLNSAVTIQNYRVE